MAFQTAAGALYLDLKVPSPPVKPTQTIPGKAEGLLIWGGGSSVGSAAIHLAKNSGFKAFVTASKKHEAYLKSLGAHAVFDYHDSDVVEQITKAAKSTDIEINMAIDAITEEDTSKLSADVLVASGGGRLVITLAWPKHEKPDGVEVINTAAYRLGTDGAEVRKWFWNEYMQGALEDGRVVPCPSAEIVDGEIKATPKAWDLLKKGVSGKKLVVKVD